MVVIHKIVNKHRQTDKHQVKHYLLGGGTKCTLQCSLFIKSNQIDIDDRIFSPKAEVCIPNALYLTLHTWMIFANILQAKQSIQPHKQCLRTQYETQHSTVTVHACFTMHKLSSRMYSHILNQTV